MAIQLIEKNLDKYKSDFDNKLKKHLKQSFNYKIIWSNFSVTPNKKLINSSHRFFRNDSIFCGSVKFKKMDLHFFGSSDSINDSKYPQFNKIPMALSFRENNIEKSAIAFGKLNNRICLLIRVEFDRKLKDLDKFNFRHKYDIYNINNRMYINFGFLDNFSEIIDNMLFFLKNVVINHNIHSFVNINSFSKDKFRTHDFNKINRHSTEKNTDNKHIVCKICGGDVDSTYSSNPKFTEYAGNKKNICANCYAKILIAYFKHRIGNKYTNKSYLISSLNQKNLIKFYIDLAERIGVIGRKHEIEFNENLDKFELFFKEVPKNMRLKKIPAGMKGISQIITIIDNETLEQGDLSKDFKKLLFDFELSEDYGWKIRKILIKEAKSNKLNKTYKHVRARINQLIRSKYSKKDVFNIFDSTNHLNIITINPDGEYNKHFKDKLVENNLSQHSGKIIKDILLNEMENNLLINATQIDTRINELIEINQSSYSKKEYFIFENSFLLNALVVDLELKCIFEMLEQLSCEFEYIIINPYSNNLMKLKMEILRNSDVSDIQNILNMHGFRKNGELNGK